MPTHTITLHHNSTSTNQSIGELHHTRVPTVYPIKTIVKGIRPGQRQRLNQHLPTFLVETETSLQRSSTSIRSPACFATGSTMRPSSDLSDLSSIPPKHRPPKAGESDSRASRAGTAFLLTFAFSSFDSKIINGTLLFNQSKAFNPRENAQKIRKPRDAL